MTATTSTAGRRGGDVRSDCWVQFERRDTGGHEVVVRSKVEAMFGDSIRAQCAEVLTGMGLQHSRLEVEDYGALPFVIAARLETAVRRAGFSPPLDPPPLSGRRGKNGAPDHSRAGMRTSEAVRALDGDRHLKPYLPEMKPHCTYGTTRERLRRSRLYLPGNEPRYFINAGLHQPDGVILDLEDSVPPAEKDAARVLVRNALRQVDFNGAERMVRINQGERGLNDLDWVVAHNVHVILVPKAESAAQIALIDEALKSIRDERGIREPVYLMPIIESALGAMKALEIAQASKFNVALALGLEDYTADIGAERTKEGRESFWMRSAVLNAARAAGIQPIDTVFSDVADLDGLRESVKEAKGLGFEGKGCIPPRQIAVIHEAFAPTAAELDKARRIVEAYEEAQAKGLGVVALGSKMIDPPVVKRAIRTLKLAEAMERK